MARLVVHIRQIGIAKVLVQAYSSDPEEWPVAKGIVTKKNKDAFISTINTLFPKFTGQLIIPDSMLEINPSDVTDMIPGITQKVKHPVTGESDSLKTVIMSLNDGYGWTREKIADWLDTLDDQPKFSIDKKTG